MKKFILPALVAAAAISGGIGYFNQPTNQHYSAQVLANIEALTDPQEIGGEWWIVDEIPCASSANELRVDYSYVNCSTCEKEAGKAAGNDGTCTVLRPVE